MDGSKRLEDILPSKTFLLKERAEQLKKSGKKIIDLGIGETDFETPERAREYGIAAIQEKFVKYTTPSGISELKEAICNEIKELIGVSYQKNEVTVSSGSKHLIYASMLALADQGEEIIVPSPYWLSYIEQAKLADLSPRILKTTMQDHFKITVQSLEECFSRKTKLLILNSPNNPTGVMYTKRELKKIAKFLEKEDVYILSDEIYSRITFGKNHVSIASFPEVREKTIVLSGMSKNYSMEGWRIGYALGKKELIDKINLVTSNTTSSSSTISQKASIGALLSPKEEVKRRTSIFKKRRDFLCTTLSTKLPTISFLKPDGAFYLFVNIQNYLGKSYHGKIIWDSTAFAEILIENGVVTVPGVEFGAEGYLRVSFAKDFPELEEAVDILAEMVGEMRWS